MLTKSNLDTKQQLILFWPKIFVDTHEIFLEPRVIHITPIDICIVAVST